MNNLITSKNILKHELIGLEASIITSNDQSLLNLTGRIVDETRNLIKMETNKGIKKVPKNIIRLRLILPNKEMVNIQGSLLVGRPEDRIKKRWRFWY